MTNIPTHPTRPDSRAVHAEAHLFTSALIRTASGAEAARQYFAHHRPLVEMIADTAVLLYEARYMQDGPSPSNDRVSALASRDLPTNCVIDDDRRLAHALIANDAAFALVTALLNPHWHLFLTLVETKHALSLAGPPPPSPPHFGL